MSATRERVTAEVLALSARLPRTVWIGVDGRGASGKSTLAAAVAAAVERAVVVTVDDFGGPGIDEWDWTRFRAQVAQPLLAGRPARYQRWAWYLDAGAEWHDVPPGAVVIVEGVSATRREAGVPWDLRIWVEAPPEVRLRRARDRDGEAMMNRWTRDWMPSEERYVAAQHPDRLADLVVDGTAVGDASHGVDRLGQ